MSILENYFGTNTDNLDDSFTTSLYLTLLDRFPHITFEDIQNSYRRFSLNNGVIEKKEFVKITIAEFCKPIIEWMNIRERLRMDEYNEKKELERKQNAENMDREQYALDVQEQIEIFNKLKSIGAKKWTGTPQQALMISRIVAKGLISDEEKRNIHSLVVEDVKRSEIEEKPREIQKIEEFYKSISFNNSSFTINCLCAERVLNLILSR